MIYLDNAATTFPKPPSVIHAVNDCLKNYSVNTSRGGHKLALRADEAVFACRGAICDFFGADGEDRVIFTSGCTAAINTVLKGTLKSGDHIICSSLEHNAVARPLNKLTAQGISYDTATVFTGDFDATLHSFEALIRDNTKMIICTHASNVTGAVLPIQRLGELCREYGLLFAVDAAQTAGVLDINVKRQNIDYLCIAPHKGLYAPMGTGVLIANKDIDDTLIEGGTGSLSADINQPRLMPDRFESGTPNLSGIVGIKAGLDFVNSKTRAAIYSGEMQLMQRAYSLLEKTDGVMLYTPMPQSELFAPLISFNIASLAPEDTAAALDKGGIAVRHGLHCAPMAHKSIGTLNGGTVRIAPSVFTTPQHIERLVYVVKNIVKTKK